MTTSAFAEYTRSTAFSMSLSAKMVDEILRSEARQRGWEISADLATRFDWYQPAGPPVFGPTSTEELLAEAVSMTTRALLRRGLAEIQSTAVVDDPVFEELEVTSHLTYYVALSTAGRLTARLLAEAGFDPYPPMVRPVGIHPDDRPKINLGPGPDIPTPRDRRLDLMLPEDEPYLEFLRKHQAVDA